MAKLSFAVLRGQRAFVVAVDLATGEVGLKAGGSPFAFDPDSDVVTTEGAVTTAMTRRGSGLLTGSSVSTALLTFRPGRFAGIGAAELVAGHPNFASIDDKAALISAIYAAAGVELKKAA